MDKVVKEITKDLANAIVRGDTMVPACSVGALLEYIEEKGMEINWTKEIPQVDGWYWVHLDFGLTSVEYIYQDEYEPDTMIVGVDDVTCPLEEFLKYNPMFYGPIKPPELSK